MRYSCKQIQDALLANDTRVAEDVLLAHLENCSQCRQAIELPESISDEIGNISLSPAPFEIYDNVMARLRSEKSNLGALRHIQLARIGIMAAAYIGIALTVILFWNSIVSLAQRSITGLLASLDFNLSDVSTYIGAISNIARGLAQSSLLIAAVLMSATLIWAFTLIKIRDTLKN
jgi:hypothetical protein